MTASSRKVLGNIVAIGGGELKDLETLLIDRAIVKLSRKKHPRVLFVPTASNDAVGYWETFREVYGKKLGCQTDVLFLIRERLTRKEIEKKIALADIIYVGGGNTLRMLRVWRRHGVDEMFRRAHENGTILSGLSAGAICWFRYGSSDARKFQNASKNFSFMRVSGLGFVPVTVSPHHIREKKLRNPGLKELMKRTPGVALALDDNSAIIFEGEKYRVVVSDARAKIRRVYRKKEKIMSETIHSTGTLESLLKIA